MTLSTLTVSKLFTYVDQKRIYTPQDGSSGLNKKYRALSRVLWDLKNDFQLPWDERTATIDYLDTVTQYSAPDGLDHIIAFHPDNFDEFRNRIDHKTIEEFIRLDNRGVDNISAVEMANRTKSLRLKFDGQHTAIVVNSATGATTNGTWAVDSGSDASNLTTDSTTYRKGGGSVNFDITVAQSGNNYAQISNSSMSAVDLSDEQDVAHFVLEVFIPDVTYITSLTLRWGSSSSAYWEKTVTTAINGGAFQSGWNTIDFDWSTATQTGSVNEAAINYLLFRVTYSASQTNDTDFRINYIRAIVPESVDYRYSTAYIAVNTSGTLIDEISAITDILMFSGMDTKFMNTVISGCLYELFGDDYQHDGKDEEKWEVRYRADKMKLEMEYPPRIKIPERRANIRITRKSMYV